ncbi:hypothetical protein PFISCL1PPCAC_6748, partial [Pristionchus fissidentatus]
MMKDELEKREKLLERMQKMKKLLAAEFSLREYEEFMDAEPKGIFSRDAVMNLRDNTEFHPFFFCPHAFRLVSPSTSSILHGKERICNSNSEKSQPSSLDGPLAILTPCTDEQKKLTGDVFEQLTQLRDLYLPCNMSRLIVETADAIRRCRVDFDQFNHPSPVSCLLCGCSIGSAKSLVRHITWHEHINKMREVNASVDANAFHFWKNAMIAAGEAGYGKRAVKTSKTLPLIGKFTLLRFEDGQVLPIDGIDPFSVLDPLDFESTKAPESVSKRAWKLNNLFLASEKNVLSRITRVLFDNEIRTCNFCNNKLISIPVLIMHIVGAQHIANV